jgi:hypothetical protein
MSNVPGVADHAGPRPSFLARAKKTVIAACGLGATLVAAGVLDDTAEAVVTGLLAIATTAGVYQARNAR